jgi:hypothetical protein
MRREFPQSAFRGSVLVTNSFLRMPHLLLAFSVHLESETVHGHLFGLVTNLMAIFSELHIQIGIAFAWFRGDKDESFVPQKLLLELRSQNLTFQVPQSVAEFVSPLLFVHF